MFRVRCQWVGAIFMMKFRDDGAGRLLRQKGVSSSEVGGSRSLDAVLAAVEKREILSALSRASGQRSKAAEMLGISRSRLYRRMQVLGIERDESRG